MKFRLSSFYKLAEGSPILVGAFMRADVPNNYTYIATQDRKGCIIGFQEIDLSLFSICSGADVIPSYILERDFSIGEEGVFPIFMKEQNRVNVLLWSEVADFWKKNASEYFGGFADYHIRKIFFNNTSLYDLLPDASKDSDGLKAWRVSQYTSFRSRDKIWELAERSRRPEKASLLDEREIIESFESNFDRIVYLSEAESLMDEDFEKKAIILFRYLWRLGYDQAMLLSAGSKLLSQFDLDSKLFRELFALLERHLRSPSMRDAYDAIIDSIQIESVEWSVLSTPGDTVGQNRLYYKARNRIQILIRLASCSGFENVVGFDSLMAIDANELSAGDLLKTIRSRSGEVKSKIQFDEYHLGYIVELVAEELVVVAPYITLYARLLHWLCLTIELDDFNFEQRSHLYNHILRLVTSDF